MLIQRNKRTYRVRLTLPTQEREREEKTPIKRRRHQQREHDIRTHRILLKQLTLDQRLARIGAKLVLNLFRFPKRQLLRLREEV